MSTMILSWPGVLQFLSCLIASSISASDISSRERFNSSLFSPHALIGVVGCGWLSISLKCSRHHSICFASVVNNLPSLALMTHCDSGTRMITACTLEMVSKWPLTDASLAFFVKPFSYLSTTIFFTLSFSTNPHCSMCSFGHVICPCLFFWSLYFFQSIFMWLAVSALLSSIDPLGPSDVMAVSQYTSLKRAYCSSLSSFITHRSWNLLESWILKSILIPRSDSFFTSNSVSFLISVSF